MLHTIGSFLFNLHQLFIWRVEREIYHRIFPHLRRERNNGYPFASDRDLQALLDQEHAKALALLTTIEHDSAQMPKAYGMAFRYIMYRDVNNRLKQYENLMRRCIRPECDPRFVATRVTA